MLSEVKMIVRRERWNELDDSSPNERISMILVEEDLITDLTETLVHELRYRRDDVSKSHTWTYRLKGRRAHHLALEKQLLVAE